MLISAAMAESVVAYNKLNASTHESKHKRTGVYIYIYICIYSLYLFLFSLSLYIYIVVYYSILPRVSVRLILKLTSSACVRNERLEFKL